MINISNSPATGVESPVVTSNFLESFGTLRSRQLPKPKQIITGLHAGEVGMIAAVTNVGKSTFLRHLAVCLATGSPFPPLALTRTPKRVVILDFEDSQAGLRDDLVSIAKSRGISGSLALDQNLHILCDTQRFRSLSDEENRERLVAEIRSLAPDLIIIDTITRGFSFEDENSNAKVREQVMNPLVQLAVETNAAVLFAHHDGKYGLEKSQNSASVHKFRGASTMGDSSRLILNLTRKSSNTLQLVAAKAKGATILTTDFRLDPDTRSLIDVTGLREKSWNKRLVSSQMEPNRSYSIAEITNSFFPEKTERTTRRAVNDEIEAGFIVMVRRGQYRLAEPKSRATDQ